MFKNFLEKLQSASYEKKKLWMIIFTSIAMVVVLYLWLAYFNNLVASLSHPAIAENSETQSKSQDFSFGETMKNGLAVILNFFGEKARGLVEILERPREYIIKP